MDLAQLKQLVNQIPDSTQFPDEYREKLNIGPGCLPAGKHWVTWFLDYAEKSEAN